MNISFDLDSTLIPNGDEFPVEKRSRLAHFIEIENIRLGTCELFKILKSKGYNIHIYTTSFRPKWKIRLMFKYYGLDIGRIVTEKENRSVLQKRQVNASKYPKAFDFDIHVDDLEGVGLEAEKFDFNAIVINPNNLDWVNTVLNKLET